MIVYFEFSRVGMSQMRTAGASGKDRYRNRKRRLKFEVSHISL